MIKLFIRYIYLPEISAELFASTSSVVVRYFPYILSISFSVGPVPFLATHLWCTDGVLQIAEICS